MVGSYPLASVSCLARCGICDYRHARDVLDATVHHTIHTYRQPNETLSSRLLPTPAKSYDAHIHDHI